MDQPLDIALPKVKPAEEAEDLPPGFGAGGATPGMILAEEKAEEEALRKQDEKPFAGAPMGTVINTIRAQTPFGEEPAYPEGMKPLRPTEADVKEFMKRPARKQKEHIESQGLQGMEQSSEYNIWYHKFLGDKFEQRGFSKAPGRCNMRVDAGWTQGCKRPDAFFCLHFARGVCAMGKECGWLHRPPNIGDQMRLAKIHDCFGRERHATHKDDMSGVGNFMQDTKTLYVGRLRPLPHEENYEAVYRHFSEWGDIEECRVIDRKQIAFVRFTHRIFAEFARECMMENHLDGDEILNVRWAYEDPNPKAIEREKRERLDYGIQRLQELGYSLDPADYDYPQDYQMPAAKKQCTDPSKAYPDTDRQFHEETIAMIREETQDDYSGAGPMTPAQMAARQAQEEVKNQQALKAQQAVDADRAREAAAVNLDALLDKIGGGPAESMQPTNDDFNYAEEHRQELFDQQQAAAEAQPLVGAWGYYSANYPEAQEVHRKSKKPQHPAAGYVG